MVRSSTACKDDEVEIWYIGQNGDRKIGLYKSILPCNFLQYSQIGALHAIDHFQMKNQFREKVSGNFTIIL